MTRWTGASASPRFFEELNASLGITGSTLIVSSGCWDKFYRKAGPQRPRMSSDRLKIAVQVKYNGLYPHSHLCAGVCAWVTLAFCMASVRCRRQTVEGESHKGVFSSLPVFIVGDLGQLDVGETPHNGFGNPLVPCFGPHSTFQPDFVP